MRTRCWLFSLLLALSGLCCASLSAAAERVPAAAFFDNPAIGSPLLSPSGKYLALRASKPGGREFLAVMDLATGESKLVAAFADVDVARFQWVNDERLLYDVTDKQLPPSSAEYANGLFAVNRDGSRFIQLADRNGYTPDSQIGTRLPGRTLLPWHTFMLDQVGAQDSEYVYVASVVFDILYRVQQVNLLRLNTLTGKSTPVHGPDGTQRWVLDQDGAPRIALTRIRDTATLQYLDPHTGEWRLLLRDHAMVPGESWLEPSSFGPDGTLYVEARSGRDTSAIHSFDLVAGKLNPVALFSTAGYDYTGELVGTRSKLLGLHFVTDAESDEWLDPGMKAIQARVDRLLPGTVNLLSVAPRAETPWLLVKSFSDTIPATWLVFNTETGELRKIGTSRPAIDSRLMGRQQPVRYAARDGLTIPALLTLPRGGGKHLPLVVLVHGGPWVRGASWGWSADTQFLASRGYAVLEPEFRGSTGFGAKHFMAGWKQWGLMMQDDLADGARWAIAQGIADPQRICIAGASYGGYATLMGLAKDPDLFKCGIDWVGVTDIDLLYTGAWNSDSDMSDEWKTYGMPVLVGDPDKDAAQLKATSPLALAPRIGQPLLLAYGGRDRRVPIVHGERFRAAVKDTNHDVEWVEYPEEGHGWALPETRIDFWTRVEKFLDKHIGKGAAPQ